jgi:large subunit ribosomal protein LP0
LIDIYTFQAKEYLANPDAFAVTAAPVAETAAAADAPKEEAKPAEEEAESDDDMVSNLIYAVLPS